MQSCLSLQPWLVEVLSIICNTHCNSTLTFIWWLCWTRADFDGKRWLIESVQRGHGTWRAFLVIFYTLLSWTILDFVDLVTTWCQGKCSWRRLPALMVPSLQSYDLTTPKWLMNINDSTCLLMMLVNFGETDPNGSKFIFKEIKFFGSSWILMIFSYFFVFNNKCWIFIGIFLKLS